MSGCSGNAPSNRRVNVDIKHTDIGDLRVRLLAPNGTAWTLHHRTGGGTRNLIRRYTVNASSVPANGIWRLRCTTPRAAIPATSTPGACRSERASAVFATQGGGAVRSAARVAETPMRPEILLWGLADAGLKPSEVSAGESDGVGQWPLRGFKP